MKKKTSLLDLMSESDRKKSLKNAKKRNQEIKYHNVSPEIYVVAEFGYYFGYDGIRAIKNNEITLDEVYILLAAARKVWYSKVVDTSHGAVVANVAAKSKSPSNTFSKGMSTFVNKMKVSYE